MKTPESLAPAVDCGIIEEVLRPLMSGKEALVYVVLVDGRECVAKVYKEASQRTFKHRAQYTEGRRTRNSRDQRAMNKRSRHGKSQDEAGWRSTEVDMICRLRDAGVRVPEYINFVDGVLIMEFVKDADGDSAPRLGDLSFTASEARSIYQQLLREVVRMLCAGVIHGDLSEFNVLMDAEGPVVIDFPQSMEAARNQSARKFLLRDVENLHRFVERYSPNEPMLAYGEEIWELYESNRLSPETELRGDYQASEELADTTDVLALIADADREENERREARGEEPATPAFAQLRKVVDFTSELPAPSNSRPTSKPDSRPASEPNSRTKSKSRRKKGTRPRAKDDTRSRGGQSGNAPTPAAQQTSDSSRTDDAAGEATPRKRRSRGRRKKAAAPNGGAPNAGGASKSEPRGGPSRAGAPKPRPATSKSAAAAASDATPAKRRRRSGRSRGRRGPAEDREPRPAPSQTTAKPRETPRSKPGPSEPGRSPARRRRGRGRSRNPDSNEPT